MSAGSEIVEKEIVLPSIPSNIVHIEPFIDAFRCEYGIGDEIYGNMLVCITEAVNNAIVHLFTVRRRLQAGNGVLSLHLWRRANADYRWRVPDEGCVSFLLTLKSAERAAQECVCRHFGVRLAPAQREADQWKFHLLLSQRRNAG